MSTSLTESFNWQEVVNLLKNSIEDISLQSWIVPLTFVKTSQTTLYLQAPSNFVKQWVLENYKDIILQQLQAYNLTNLEITLQQNYTNPTEQNKPLPEHHLQSSQTLENAENEAITSTVNLNPKYTFNSFVVGKSNEFAYSAAKKFASNHAVEFNTLFLYGASGLGKTHLMHAIAWELANSKSKKKCLYLTAESFMHSFINALQSKTMISFKDMVRNVDVLMVDDFQFMNGKESTQEEFFHTFNTLISQGKNIIFSADKSPLVFDRIEDRIRSRLQGGLIVNINATTYELRVGILQQKLKEKNIKLSKDVIDFLANTLTSNVRELEGALNRIITYMDVMKTKITLPVVFEVLDDIIKQKNKPIEIETIVQRVAEFYKIKITDIKGTKREKKIVLARQVAMYIAKNNTKLSLQDIGRNFGSKSHASVLHAVNKIAEEITLNPNLSNDINLIINIIQKS